MPFIGIFILKNYVMFWCLNLEIILLLSIRGKCRILKVWFL